MLLLRRWFYSFRRDDDAQDLVEYTLLLGFLAMAAIAILSQVGVNIQGPWSTAQTTLAAATAAPTTTTVSTPAPPPPAAGQGGQGDHDGH